MKSKIKNRNPDPKPKPFPKLMISNITGFVVLFSKEEEGIVVNKGDGFEGIGYKIDFWRMSGFKDFDGKVILSND